MPVFEISHADATGRLGELEVPRAGVTVETPTPRLWGWAVDGLLEASDEPRRRLRDVGGGQLSFRSQERKRVRRRWDGRIKHVGDPTRWEPATGDVEISAFLAVDGRRPAGETTIRIE